MPVWKPGLGPLALVAVAAGLAAAIFAGGKPADPNAPRGQDGQVVPRLDATHAAAIARRMDADASLRPWLARCPADAWRRRGDLAPGGVTLKACGDAPDDCLANCLEFSSGHACFALARILEDTSGLGLLYAQTLFQLACASGEVAGCVNRAAGLRNTSDAGDPFPKHPDAAREACQYESFAIGCDANDAWGCTMRGQAYRGARACPRMPPPRGGTSPRRARSTRISRPATSPKVCSRRWRRRTAAARRRRRSDEGCAYGLA